ncbi:MAG: lipase maturation factor family protein [Actinomycetota bacterium]|nr:lipase maturation factor family protein [Actinomycetota bacterium]
MTWLQAPDYWLARLVLQRGLAAVYLIAFVVAVNQFRPLLGERGLLPLPRFVAAVPFRRAPSLFHLHYSDRFFGFVAWTGVVLAAAGVAGLPAEGPLWVSMLAWFFLWALYLSIVNVGQVFYAFGWETILLEAGFLAIFLGPSHVAPPTLVLLAMRWLVFRVEFGAGLIKLRGDRCWRDLTCLDYHHETQPLPNPLSWYFHRLPKPLHKAEVLGNYVAQLVAPVGLFLPQPIASVSAAVIIVTQLWLVASGNFSWLNAVTIVLAFSACHDSFLGPLLPGGSGPAQLADGPVWYHVAVIALAAVVVVLSYGPVRNMASRRQRMNTSFNALRLVNTYGAFGSVTKQRYEVVVQGTDATDLSAPGVEWREYEFKGKPGDPRRRPPQVAPYHLRLDWLMWFLALPGRFDDRWFMAFLARLLENDAPTLKLLRANPFPDAPPHFVRARLYRYRYTTRAERRETGAWWVRTWAGEVVAPMSLTAAGRR